MTKLIFKPGDLILHSQPYAFALYSEERQNYCDYCFQKISCLFLCENCNYVNFCSKKCKTLGNEIHRLECEILKKRPLRNLTRLLARVILIHQSDPTKNEPVGEEDRTFDHLMNHLNNVKSDEDAMLTFNMVFGELELLFKEELDINEILNFYGKILVNSFAIQDNFFRPIGRAIFLGASIFDHSCVPDASFLFIGTQIYIKALVDIKADNFRGIYISYLNELDHHDERIYSLQCQYYFTCQCNRCTYQAYIENANIVKESVLKALCDKVDKLCLDYPKMLMDFSEFQRTYPNRLISLCDYILKEHLKDDVDKQKLLNETLESTLPLLPNIRSIGGPLTAKMLDFVSSIQVNVRLSCLVIDYFRKFYGKHHPRLALKLLLTAYQMPDKECALKIKLLEEAVYIGQLITPSFAQLKPVYVNRNSLLKALNSSFLGEVEKILFTTRNHIQVDRKCASKALRVRSRSVQKTPSTFIRNRY